MSEDLKAITTKTPTYLEMLLQENYEIKLVCRQKNNIKEEKFFKVNNSIENTKCHDESCLSELDLTGAPLKVDLGGDDFVGTDSILVRASSWTTEEAGYNPITIKEARKFLDNNFKLKQSDVQNNKPIYCICDGSDPRHTVILGGSVTENKLARTLVYILPCCSENDEVTTFEYMSRDHINSVTRNAKIKYLHIQNYSLWGYNLRNCDSLETSQYNGSIAVEVTNDKPDHKDTQRNSCSTLNLQIIRGHNSSPVHSFWEELCLLQSYIDIFTNTEQLCETTVISEQNVDDSEITFSINELLLNNITCFKNEVDKPLDLKNVREETILDKLWVILKNCSKLSDLRDALHFFFEGLIETDAKICISSEDNSAISDIINGILEGKFAVPTLSFSQSLELLIDLGLEKLKNDYLVIISSFYFFAKDLLLKRWRNFSNSNLNHSPKRRTKMSINSKMPVTDLRSSKLKLSYLDSTHQVIEFMFLCKGNLNLSQECYDYFCESICNNFMNSNENINQFNDISKLRLCEFSLNLFPEDASTVKELSPTTWLLKMISTLGSSEVTTVFYFSEHPIFPPNVYDNYDISFGDMKTLYVTKLVKYVQKC